jgi:hypothetical protein
MVSEFSEEHGLGVLAKRTAPGSREKFEKALEQVPDVPPDENDRL